MSLGRISFNPVWVFYRGTETLDRLSQLEGKRIGLGLAIRATTQILAANGVNPDNATMLNRVGPAAAKALKDGEVDVIVTLGELNTPYIQSLLRDPTVRLIVLRAARTRTRAKRERSVSVRAFTPCDRAPCVTSAGCAPHRSTLMTRLPARRGRALARTLSVGYDRRRVGPSASALTLVRNAEVGAVASHRSAPHRAARPPRIGRADAVRARSAALVLNADRLWNMCGFLRRVASFAQACRQIQSDTRSAGWHDDWRSTASLPPDNWLACRAAPQY